MALMMSPSFASLTTTKGMIENTLGSAVMDFLLFASYVARNSCMFRRSLGSLHR